VRPEPSDLKGRRVLVVDDNFTNRLILQKVLTNWEAEVTTVDSGPAALESVESAKKDQRPFHVIVLDCHMPGMDGFMVADHVRKQSGPAQPIILMLSSASQVGDIDRCRQLGIAVHLTKPIRQFELLEALHQILGTYRLVQPAVHQPVENEAIRPRAGLRVLLAEDNAVNQKLAVRILEKWGHSVRVVSNGKLAVEAIAAEKFDVVFMDLQMPEMGGFEATAIIRQREASSRSPIAIIAMTAHAMKGDREKCLSAGMDGYVSKPLSPKEIADVLQSVVPGSGDANRQYGPDGQDLTGKRFEILERIGGDADFLKELACAFIANSEDLLREMQEAIGVHDFKSLARAAHTYKGSAGVFGLSDIVKAAAELEITAGQQNRARSAALISDLQLHTRQASQFLLTLIEEVPCVS